MTQALLVVDAQNEFSAGGKRAVPNHSAALAVIRQHVDRAREERRPIAWVRHHNKPNESRAFVPGSWGAEFSIGLGPESESESDLRPCSRRRCTGPLQARDWRSGCVAMACDLSSS